MAKKKEKVVKIKNSESNNLGNEKLCAILSYLLIGVVWYFADEKLRKNKFANFHAKQGLVLFIVDLIFWAVSCVPLLGWIIHPILSVMLIIFVILGIINAANGKEKELPIIGQYAQKFEF